MSIALTTPFFRVYVAAGSSLSDVSGVGLQDNTFDFWGVQVEAGSVATAFQTATGTLAGELAACQRYYQRLTNTASSMIITNGFAFSTTAGRGAIPFKTTMRFNPTALEQSGTATDYELQTTGGTVVCNAVPTVVQATIDQIYIAFPVASGLTAGQGLALRFATSSGYLGWSAEL